MQSETNTQTNKQTNKAMNIDFKVSLWTRVTVREEDKDKVLNALKSGDISGFSDIYELTEDPQWEILTDTMEDITTQDDSDSATIEAIESGDSLFDQKTIYTNKETPQGWF